MTSGGRPRRDADGLVRWAPHPAPTGPRDVATVLDHVLTTDPRRLAVVDADRSLTYADLDVLVNRMTHVLAGQGIGSGDRVAVSLPNGIGIIALFLAVMRLGAIWVGINRVLAPPEVRTLLDDSDAELFLAEPATVERVAVRQGCRVLEVGPSSSWARLVDAAAPGRVDVPIDPHAPAAIAYTSGTTGTPKGAVHSQHSIVLPGIGSALDGRITGETRIGVALPLSILNLQILGPVAAFVNGAVCIPIDRIDVPGLVERVRRDRVTRLAVPPTTVYDMLASPEVTPDDIASLDALSVGGAGTPPGLQDRYHALTGRWFVTSYGLTELPTAAAIDDRRPPPPQSSGLPLGHVRVEIRDQAGEVVPAGTDGDIWVGPRDSGPLAYVYSPMLGYWRRPERSDEVVRDGWLLTGDTGHLEDDGSLVVVGRRSEVIIRGGANVYPNEVERVLLSVPGVVDAAVLGLADERLGEVVVAAVVTDQAAGVTADVLRQACAQRLARYKIPARFDFVEAFPRNVMGKIARPRLREILASRW